MNHGASDAVSLGFNLLQNYPNPFNPTTTIRYTIPSSAVMLSRESRDQHLNNETPKQVRGDKISVTLKVYDILGREITTLVNKFQSPGIYDVDFLAGNLTSGIYFYRLSVGDPSSSLSAGQAGSGHPSTGSGQGFIDVKKMILLK